MTEANDKKTKSWINKIVMILFAAVVMWGIFSIIYKNVGNFTTYKDTLLGMNWFVIALVIVLQGCTSSVRGVRWFLILKPVNSAIKFIETFNIYMLSMVANFSAPGKLDIPFRAYMLKRRHNIEVSKSITSILATIFIEHSTEITLAFFCVIIGGHYSMMFSTIQNIFSNSSILINSAIFMGIILFIILGLWVVQKKIKSMNFLSNIAESFRLTRNRKDLLLVAFAITAVNIVVNYLIFSMVLFQLTDLDISLTFIIFAGTITNFVGLISPLPGGIGVKEITMYGLYDLYYDAGEIAFLAQLIMRLCTYAVLLILALMSKLLNKSENMNMQTGMV